MHEAGHASPPVGVLHGDGGAVGHKGTGYEGVPATVGTFGVGPESGAGCESEGEHVAEVSAIRFYLFFSISILVFLYD